MNHTLFDKIWNDHVVTRFDDNIHLLHIDRILLHERSGSIALGNLGKQGRQVRNPANVFATMDHVVDTRPGRGDSTPVPGGSDFIETLRRKAAATGITLFDVTDPRQGISHVIAAEQGIALPGCTVICADSHTCTLGGLGALAWGVGASECEHALATETLRVTKPRQMHVAFNGNPPSGVTAKDMILALIGEHTAHGAAGYAIEFSGTAVEHLSPAARFTLCNMAVEFSAFTALIAPDATTLDYLRGLPFAPRGSDWQSAETYWRALRTDAGARFDMELSMDISGLAPMVTWGTSPQHAVSVTDKVPDPSSATDAPSKQAMQNALQYMGLASGTRMEGLAIDCAFIGSCTNSRLEDLRQAASILRGRRVAGGVRAICVPGSTPVKHAAEAEGLHLIFTAAGFEWRESGCSMCFYSGGESFGFRKRVISSTNRNFEGRQGRGTRTHLASPATVAASAIEGRIADPRKYLSPS